MVFIKKASMSREVWYCLEVLGGSRRPGGLLLGLVLKGVCPLIKWLLRVRDTLVIL